MTILNSYQKVIVDNWTKQGFTFEEEKEHFQNFSDLIAYLGRASNWADCIRVDVSIKIAQLGFNVTVKYLQRGENK